MRTTCLTAAVLLLGAWTVLLTAWMCDDAYISFRAIDNLVNGYGLRWNVDERVQAFSNPLWVMLLAPLYAVTGEIYFTALALSGLTTLATLWVVMRRCTPSLAAGAIAAVALVLSPSFVAFSTSGLENTLTHLLVASFCAQLFSEGPGPAHKAGVLTLIASLAALNRLDTALLFAPPLVAFAWQHRSRATLRAMAIGTLPLVAWEIFSVVYYGTPLPNTAYAKLGTGIPPSDLVAQGVRYFAASAAFDPMGTCLIVMAIVVAPCIDRRFAPFAIAIGAHLVYVLVIGGDFMAGRFFSAAIVAAAATLAAALPRIAPVARRIVMTATGAGVLAIGASTAHATVASSRLYTPENFQIPRDGILDERMYYYWATGLLSPYRTEPISHTFASEGMKLRTAGERVHVAGAIGFLGYFAGPGVHIVDVYALCDPLLARLPSLQPWRIGHFERAVPAGYVETLATGLNRIEDPAIARLYDLVTKATRGPIRDDGRLAAIVALAVGDEARVARQGAGTAQAIAPTQR